MMRRTDEEIEQIGHTLLRGVTRPAQIGGADRLLVTVAGAACFLVGYSFLTNPLVWVAAIAAWMLLVAVLRWMGQRDPYMRQVYWAQKDMPGYYAATAKRRE